MRRFVAWIALNLVTIALVTALWSYRNPIKTWFAIRSFDRRIEAGDLLDSTLSPLANARIVQKHFSESGLYVPIEDIVFAATNESPFDTLRPAMQRICGTGDVYIWIPMTIDRPLVGEKVVELCLARRLQ